MSGINQHSPGENSPENIRMENKDYIKIQDEPEQGVLQNKTDVKKRLVSYLMDTMTRASDELYQICTEVEDISFCEEVVVFLQKIISNFDSFEKMIKLKYVPSSDEMDSITSSECVKKTGDLESNFSIGDCDDQYNPTSSSGINVSAPDFIPSATNLERKCTNESAPTYSNEKGKENNNKNMDVYAESEHSNEQHDLRYFDEFGGSTMFNNQNFSHNILPPNLYPFHATPYQHFTHHYMPQMSSYHVPYSIYSSGIRNTNILTISQVNSFPHQKSFHSRSQIRGSRKSTRGYFNYNNPNTSCRNGNNRQPFSHEKSDPTREKLCNLLGGIYPTVSEDDDSRLVLNSLKVLPTSSLSDRDISETVACSSKTSLENDEENNAFGNCQAQPIELKDKKFPETESSLEKDDDSSRGEKFIFNKTENEHRTHFPKLSSGNNKKGVHLKLNSPEVTQRVKNVEEKGMTFSEVTKITHEVIDKLPNPSSDNSFLRSKNKSVAGKVYSTPAKLYTSRRTEMSGNVEVWLNELCTYMATTDIPSEQHEITLSSNSNNKMVSSEQQVENEDTEGWEVVKTRSKWRESFSLKPPRHQKSPNSGFYKDSKLFGLSTTNSEQNVSIGFEKVKVHLRSNYEKSALNTIKGGNHLSTKKTLDQNNFSKVISYNSTNMNKSFDTTTSENNYMKLDSFNDSHSNEGESSNETLDEHLILQSEESSPELGLYDENVSIDPNEMYSAYMQYLSNVEEEEVFSGSSNLELVLHPEILTGMIKETASLEQITYFVNNDPIRALAFKKKLDSRIRLQEDVKKKNDEKQQLAHEKRLQFLHDKTAKFRGFVQKVEEVKAAQHQLALLRKNKLDLKLKKAEEKRKMHLNIIKRKAHDEEEKLKEIAFINELEAQNRRHDSLALRQEHEERLQCLVEERQRRLEEKAAKEAAVEERRKALEAERQEKLELMKEKRRRKEEIIDRKQQEREQERLVNAREKAREREIRLMARHTAHQATVEELQKKIQQKQEKSARRHIESIELIRQKAIEIGIHRNTSDCVPKYLNLYKPDLKGNKEHDKYKLCLKKRLKKIKSRMALRGTNYIEVTHRTIKELTTKESLLEKVLKKLQKYEPHKVYLWEPEDCDVVDHYLDEILYFLQEEPSLKNALKDMKAFLFFESVINCFNYATHEKCSVPSLRCILKIITICDLSCIESVEVCLYFLLSNILATLLDSLKFSLQALERPCKSWDLIVELLLRFHALVIDGLCELPETMLLSIPDFERRMKDLISYILCSGLVNRLIDLFRPSIIDEKFIYKSLVVPSILFFKRLLSTWFISDDLVDILKSTDLLCTVPLLYEGLMKQITNGGPLPEYCMPTISLFLKLADLDLKVFQDILGAENIALQWRGIASGLMTYCVSQNNSSSLLNSVIRLVGYFAIHNIENQTLLQSGKQPTVLQQLVKLPFQYFCDPEYMYELYPTLISCSYNNSTNRAIVENEIDYNGLEKFMHSETGQKNKIIQLLLSSNEQEDLSINFQGSPKRNIHAPD